MLSPCFGALGRDLVQIAVGRSIRLLGEPVSVLGGEVVVVVEASFELREEGGVGV